MSSFFHSQTDRSLTSVLFLTVIYFTSCQTTRPFHQPISMPVIMQPLFGACHPTEDEARLEIEKKGTRIFSANMVWAFAAARNSVVQINSLFGDTILELRADAGRWSANGQVQINVGESGRGFLTINGYDVPVKSSELGCILAGVWPVEWLRWLEITRDDRQTFRIEGNDGQRTVKIEMENDSRSIEVAQQGRNGCAHFKWGGFFGFFQRQAVLCREKIRDNTRVRLSGINNYLINWTIDNGE